MNEINVPLKVFLDELKKNEKNPDKRRDFHVFYLRKHDMAPNVYPLTFSLIEGGLNIWQRLYMLWESGQLQ